MARSYDVVICGGGLAGLTLARQIRRETPRARVLVCEKRAGTATEAAFKVGESTVEIGAHYFRRIVDLEDVLVRDHLPKMGLRYFFSGGDNHDVTTRFELGPPSFPFVPAYQIDRGRLENTLADLVREAGVDLLDGARVRELYNTGVGWRQVVEKMYQNASVAEWYRQHGKHAVYANPRKSVPLPEVQPVTLLVPRDGRLIPWAVRTEREPVPVGARLAPGSSST